MRCFDNIAKLIRTKRINHTKGYSQSELSNLLGYKNGQFISNVERALCNVPLKMLKKVSEVLDIHPSELKEAILKDQETTLDSFLAMEGNPTVNNKSGSSLNEYEASEPVSTEAKPSSSKYSISSAS